MAKHYYIMDDSHNVIETDYDTWRRWNSNPDNRKVAFTKITDRIGVNTVFLMGGSDPSTMFQAMIVGGTLGNSSWRYSTWDDAVAGHAVAVQKATDAQG